MKFPRGPSGLFRMELHTQGKVSGLQRVKIRVAPSGDRCSGYLDPARSGQGEANLLPYNTMLQSSHKHAILHEVVRRLSRWRRYYHESIATDIWRCFSGRAGFFSLSLRVATGTYLPGSACGPGSVSINRGPPGTPEHIPTRVAICDWFHPGFRRTGSHSQYAGGISAHSPVSAAPGWWYSADPGANTCVGFQRCNAAPGGVHAAGLLTRPGCAIPAVRPRPRSL